MKKILFLAFTLVIAVGMTAAAADVSFSGRVEVEAQGFGRNVPPKEGDQVRALDMRFQVSVDADEFNSAFVRFRRTAADDTTPVDVDRAHFTSNLGAWIGDFTGAPLPMGISYNIGWNEFTYADIAEITAYENEALAAHDFTDLGHRLSFTFVDMVNVYVASTFAEALGVDADDGDGDRVTLPKGLLAGADAMIPIEGVGTLGLEVVYSARDVDEAGALPAGDIGYVPHLGFAAYFGMPGIAPDLDLELSGSYTMDLFDYDDDDVVPTFFYGVGLAVDYLQGLVGASLSFSGAEEWEGTDADGDDADLTAMSLGIGLSSSPIDFLSFDVGIGLGIDEDFFGEMMNSADISMTFSPGAANFTLGYWWVNDDAFNIVGSINAVEETGRSAFYLSTILEY